MVERNVLQWDNQVTNYVPNFKLHDSKETQALTIRDLLSQRTGLPDFANDNLIEEGKTFKEAIDSLYTVPLVCSVGSCYAYQNVTFSMMGDILKKAAGKSYSELLKENIFKPLKMQNASTTPIERMANGNFADCHQLNANGVFITCPMSEFGDKLLPSAGVNASLDDLIIWLRVQMGAYPNVINPAVLKAVETPQITIPPNELNKFYAPWQIDRLKNASYGMGWRIDDYAGTPMIFHSGSLNGFSSAIGFLPKQEIGVVVLVNTDNFPATILMAQFFDLFLDIPLKDWGGLLLQAKSDALNPKRINKSKIA